MGKAKKLKPSQMGAKVPLEQSIEAATFARPKNRNKIRLRMDEDDQFVDSNLSRKILSAAREQQREVSGEDSSPICAPKGKIPKLTSNDSDDSEDDDVADEGPGSSDMFYEDVHIDEEDERAIEMFMSDDPAPRRNLADVIREKLSEKQTEVESMFSDTGSVMFDDLKPEVVAYYENVGKVLSHYRCGKIPKAFKHLPVSSQWQQLLNCTNPSGWSAAAMYQATRIFASRLNNNSAQEFFSLVLLPRLRDDLAEYKRLSFHLYQALLKAMYKPKAFIKGIILPLLQSGNCTLREAIIIGSALAKNSFPIMHASVAINNIADMEYTGASSIFLRIFFEKKYNLPLTVIDAVCAHFIRFRFDKREMPVLWHQALLSFVQRYKNNFESDFRDSLLELLTIHKHPTITPEVHRELKSAKCRDPIVEMPTKAMDI